MLAHQDRQRAVVEWTYYVNPGDTIISGEDASAKPLQYNPDSVQVYLNGVQLSKKLDLQLNDDGSAIISTIPSSTPTIFW